MIRLTLPLMLVALTGCIPPGNPPAETPPPAQAPLPPRPVSSQPTTCGAEHVRYVVGKKRTPALAEEVSRRSGAKAIRWISPGMAVTMDYREERLNVDLDDRDVIKGVRCG